MLLLFYLFYELKNRMGKLIDSARRWIKNDVPNGSKVGIVRFR